MKIEIYLTDCFHPESDKCQCFYAEEHVKHGLSNHSMSVYGIAIIDGITAKFYFSPIGMDGAVFTSNPDHESLLKHLIPSWYYSKMYLATKK